MLIKGGRIVTAVDDYVADILVRDGQIEAIARDIPADSAAVHQATGLLVFPGGVDVHTHMQFDLGTAQTVDTFETGTRSAAFGGTTTIIDFALQKQGETPKQTLDRRLAEAEPQCCVDYSFHIILTHVTLETLAELPDLINHEGISSFKMFMAYPGVLMVDDADIFRAMRFVQLTATAPAKMFGLFPRKGAIAVGSDADLVLFDPLKPHTLSASTHHSNADYSLYEGKPVTGKVEKVFLRGQLIVNGNEWLGDRGGGKFQQRSASGRVM
jgi:dihydroorotase-like cyclic amidohydrolase